MIAGWLILAQLVVVPKGFPKPPVPAANPITAAKVELGRYLFYDKRLSVNGKSSCATCHQQERAFTDGLAVSIGTTGEPHPRSAMTLVNVAYAATLTWNNPQLTALEEQALVPMYGVHLVELGLRTDDTSLSKLNADPKYRALLGNDRLTRQNVTAAIASFERTIISARSPFDRYHYGGDDNAVSTAAKRGEILFFSHPLSCFRCHGGFNFSDATELHNTGVNNDTGKFKAPTLRNIALTAPYMHDASMATLSDVLDHYSAGGRVPNNPSKDPLIAGFQLTAADKADLIAFLESLTDQEVLHDPRFSNPW